MVVTHEHTISVVYECYFKGQITESCLKLAYDQNKEEIVKCIKQENNKTVTNILLYMQNKIQMVLLYNHVGNVSDHVRIHDIRTLQSHLKFFLEIFMKINAVFNTFCQHYHQVIVSVKDNAFHVLNWRNIGDKLVFFIQNNNYKYQLSFAVRMYIDLLSSIQDILSWSIG